MLTTLNLSLFYGLAKAATKELRLDFPGQWNGNVLSGRRAGNGSGCCPAHKIGGGLQVKLLARHRRVWRWRSARVDRGRTVIGKRTNAPSLLLLNEACGTRPLGDVSVGESP